jgi:capsular polysaccharide biosynthesis protein
MIDRLSSMNGMPAATPESSGETPVDLKRVTGALRESRRLVAAIVVLVTGAVLVVSLLSPARYRTDARIADDPASGEAADIATADRQLATSRALVTAPTVLARAAERVPGETADSLAAKVSASVGADTSILDVAATDGNPERAAQIANAVANTFLAERATVEREVVARARERLQREIAGERRAKAPQATLDALNQRLSELAVSEVLAGSNLRLVQPAAVPEEPYAPRPVRSAVIAFFAALFVGVLIALARDRLRASPPDARTLAAAADLPLIAALPATAGKKRRRRFRRRRVWAVDHAMIEEAALQSCVRTALPPRAQRVVLVHGIDGDGSVIAATLARSLSWAGHATALVRMWPADRTAPAPDVPLLEWTDVEDDIGELRRSDVRYAIVESPPPSEGTQLRQLARHMTAVILVARLGSSSLTDAAATRRLVDALGLHPLGLVVTCSAAEAAAIERDGFEGPLRPPSRPRAASPNGALGERERAASKLASS